MYANHLTRLFFGDFKMKKFIICAVCAVLDQYELEELCGLIRHLSTRPIQRWVLRPIYHKLFCIIAKKFKQETKFNGELREEMRKLSEWFIIRKGDYPNGCYLL